MSEIIFECLNATIHCKIVGSAIDLHSNKSTLKAILISGLIFFDCVEYCMYFIHQETNIEQGNNLAPSLYLIIKGFSFTFPDSSSPSQPLKGHYASKNRYSSNHI